MKIIVCGKGGSGKSTVVALLAKAFERLGRRVIVMDCDESNPGLYRYLGVKQPKELIEFLGGRKAALEKLNKGSGPTFLHKEFFTEELPRECIEKKGNIFLITIGKIHDFGQGCACPMGAVSRKLIKNIKLKDNEILLADTDAGVEHFGRGVEEGCDIILFVIDPSMDSLILAQKVDEICRRLEKRLFYVINRANEKIARIILEKMKNKNVLAILPEKEEILMAGLHGEELKLKYLEEIIDIADKLLKLIHH
ncbi:MAG: nucleotide-binding protein [Candidatus Baldrarchaeia archaeon]